LWGNARALATFNLGHEGVGWEEGRGGDGAAAVARLANVQHRISCVAAVKDAPRIPDRDWGHAFGGETAQSASNCQLSMHRPQNEWHSTAHHTTITKTPPSPSAPV